MKPLLLIPITLLIIALAIHLRNQHERKDLNGYMPYSEYVHSRIAG